MKAAYPDLKITWWLNDRIQHELSEPANEGIYKFWFGKEVITQGMLQERFELAKASWLGERYVPRLHTPGFIEGQMAGSLYAVKCRNSLAEQVTDYNRLLKKGLVILKRILADATIDEVETEFLEDIVTAISQAVDFLVMLTSKIESGEESNVTEISRFKADYELPSQLDRDTLEWKDRQLLSRLEELLAEIRRHGLHRVLKSWAKDIVEPHKIFLGQPGSGKTHALSHATDIHLKDYAPAVIIQAQDVPTGNWGEILSGGLQLNGWEMDELFNALEIRAVLSDRQLLKKERKFGEESDFEQTKVLICIDGLDEASGKWNHWKKRIGECVVHWKRHPRLRFMFSSRNYFFEEHDAPLPGIQVVQLPAEGDVPYQNLFHEYFKPAPYNIKLSSPSIIRGIDSLFALRLFCQVYQNQVLDEASHVITAGDRLFAGKLKKMELDFLKRIPKPLGSTSQPVATAINYVANAFIDGVKATHDELCTLIRPGVESYLDGNEIDLLIDFLADNAILFKRRTKKVIEGIPVVETDYFMIYRSIPEIVIASRVVKRILAGEIDNITDEKFFSLFKGVSPKRLLNTDTPKRVEKSRERIRQLIVNMLFHEHGKLIGEDGFLRHGLPGSHLFNLRFQAMIKAPRALANQYRNSVDSFFFGTRAQRITLLRDQILPASAAAENNFGALYLHELLSSYPNAFDRDKIWHGKDRFDDSEDPLLSLKTQFFFFQTV